MKLSEGDRIEIRARRKAGALYKTLADDFDCSVPHIAAIIAGRVGADDPLEAPPKPQRTINAMPWCTEALLTGRRAPRAKLAPAS